MAATTRFVIVATSALLVALGSGSRGVHAQQAAGPAFQGSIFPTQLNPGQTTVLHVALPRNNPVQRLEITPSQGIAVTKTASRDLNQGSVWWEFTVEVAKDATPGPRTLVGVQQTGRTPPVTLTIPDHVPSISNLKIVSARPAQEMIELQFAASTQVGSFSATPYVWFLLACGPGQPETGVVRGTFAAGTVRARIPNPKTPRVPSAAPATGDRCELDVRATDSSGVDSNTSTAMFDFES